ncbi:hypothetical protein NGR_c06760 [Sinorhizobium fredii NGR234]|uniref:Uncharacterized protein n=1 Tax=Sinorhizobium fredii (strain NBRC 101917 / NGR234) TaxID=394 RepID=C3MIC1_SINFN|nr:hypothetical protein [Sinorhizobium fredii]ACP24469.1 hypothetical protein NGR_c06760 [Sinorhizobium fredii NGR234]
MKTIELDCRSIKNPAHCYHKRGRNWAAIMRGKNAANCDRDFLRSTGDIVDLDPVLAGDVVEFGGDYITSTGRREPDRRWWHVRAIADDAMTYEAHPTLAKALKAAREAAASLSGAHEVTSPYFGA